ncbi:c-type cytochrome [Bacillus shivajii]|uniref:cytochrome-c peroxidase n=1 Tax=Bacillus shivajii TaxID=1983719 RepID=UPI001CFABD6A|nr:cytochrome c peroxidase [Bacillus shivajii]UCZ55044.1 c-type cytochrome [Bacillus shivajii]
MMKKFILSMLAITLSGIFVACSDELSSGDMDEDLTDLVEELLSNDQLVPLGDIPIPEDNPMISEVLHLGEVLYFDKRLSGNDQVSCMSCHIPELGYGDGRATFETFDGGDGPRNSPTIINSGYYTSNFWDGRASSLEEQALGPIEDPNEMNMLLDDLIPKLQGIEGYEELFIEAGFDEITPEAIGKALAAFQRQIVVKDTSYDRFLKGETDALTNQEIRGLDLFAGEAGCINCHNGENLSDNQFYNVGLDTDDEGRYAVTGDEADKGAIRTPGLYGITHTGPYMSDGSIRTLEEVIEFYNRGGDGHPNTDSLIFELNLTDQEKEDLLAFLEVLGGEPPMFSKPELPGDD